ncbi:hypothetical protein [Celeribacter baekdonensis]|uniref:Lipoprotein n=1 Tax=Celeribacter baekdonensis TaxID=875171 RepID=A0A2R4M2D7_9RHOB|nr:hypothetical protein [Celeribacter baekdonensis]AVW91306.1 hypothetical protein DA792_09620 [Celeribacter baekdonensis]
MKTLRTALALLVATWGLAGCLSNEATEVSQDGFTFAVAVTGDTAVARNYHTGRLNFAKLEEAARAAIETASGCAVRTLVKRGEINTFDATLNCAG